MYLRAIGGWSLLAAGLASLLRLIVGAIAGRDGSPALLGADEVLSLLFLLGLPAIRAAQPQIGRIGQLGQVGLLCLGFAVGLALVLRAIMLVSTADIGDIAPFLSALLGAIGGTLVGWVTVRARIFPPAVGWLLIAGGLLNLVSGLTPALAFATALGIIGMLAQAGADIGYGWGIVGGAHGRLRPA